MQDIEEIPAEIGERFGVEVGCEIDETRRCRPRTCCGIGDVALASTRWGDPGSSLAGSVTATGPAWVGHGARECFKLLALLKFLTFWYANGREACLQERGRRVARHELRRSLGRYLGRNVRASESIALVPSGWERSRRHRVQAGRVVMSQHRQIARLLSRDPASLAPARDSPSVGGALVLLGFQVTLPQVCYFLRSGLSCLRDHCLGRYLLGSYVVREPERADLLFQEVRRRYERRSLVLTVMRSMPALRGARKVGRLASHGP